jgi:hypothetical protein
MPRGTPDWGTGASGDTVAPVVDFGEVVARLGGISLVDRRGKCVWYDRFENGTGKWGSILNGAGAAFGWSNVISRAGMYSAQLITGSNGDRSAEMQAKFPCFAKKRFGVECAFAADQYVEEVQIASQYYDTDATIRGAIALRFLTKEVVYYKPDDTWGNLESFGSIYHEETAFNVVKLVIDFSEVLYTRAIINFSDSPMGVVPYSGFYTGGAYYLLITIKAIGASGRNASVYVDDVLVTVDEP